MTRSSCMLALALCVAPACRSVAPEASQLIAAVERFHRAENDERPARADEIAAVACEDKDVCDARKACVDATGDTGTALRLKREAEVTLADLEGGKLTRTAPAVVALPEKLDRASHLLEQGHAAMPACDKKILVLRQRYGL